MPTKRPTTSNNKNWIYHERQEALLCGQHALNNLVQRHEFSADELADFAQQLDFLERQAYNDNTSTTVDGFKTRGQMPIHATVSSNVDESGNFSIQVLQLALSTRYHVNLVNILQDDVKSKVELTEIDGFICNNHNHWFSIRKIRGKFWKLDSCLPRPVTISHFHLAAELESLHASGGYSVFCVLEKGMLPEPCSSDEDRESFGGLDSFWWNEDDLIADVTTARTGANDHWRLNNVGTGMRLDGKSTMTTNMGNNINIDGLTDEEQLALAIQESMVSPLEQPKKDELVKIPLRPEPGAREPEAVRIQFRLPDGQKKVRSFLQTELVGVLYTFVKECCPDHDSTGFELLAGFPPRDLIKSYNHMIQEAKLSGEMIQCRPLL